MFVLGKLAGQGKRVSDAEIRAGSAGGVGGRSSLGVWHAMSGVRPQRAPGQLRLAAGEQKWEVSPSFPPKSRDPAPLPPRSRLTPLLAQPRPRRAFTPTPAAPCGSPTVFGGGADAVKSNLPGRGCCGTRGSSLPQPTAPRWSRPSLWIEPPAVPQPREAPVPKNTNRRHGSLGARSKTGLAVLPSPLSPAWPPRSCRG